MSSNFVLTAGETQLVDAVRAGTKLTLLRRPDGTRQPIRAAVLRELLLGRLLPLSEMDPRGVRIIDADITGHLDLSFLVVPVPLTFSHCSFAAGLRLTSTRLARLILRGCSCDAGPEPALAGDGLVVDSELLLTDNFSATSASPHGTIRLSGASVSHLKGRRRPAD